MPIILAQGNIVDSGCQCIVNTVNCVGVMGKGVALAIRHSFPEVMPEYLSACRSGTMKPGDCLFVSANGKIIANIATKFHWKNPSRYEWVDVGLANLLAGLIDRGIKSVAIPPPGCGNGGLDWSVVWPMIESIFGQSEISAHVYCPPGFRWV